MAREIWAKVEEEYILKNTHLSNQQLAANLGRTLASVENKVRDLGCPRVFQKHEVETLKRVWGQSGQEIMEALPRFTWRQISKKANNIGLPSLAKAQSAFSVYSLVDAMGETDTTLERWREAGLEVRTDRIGNSSKLFVDIDTFWKFASEHSEIVDISRLFSNNVEEILGVPPDYILELKDKAKPFKRKRSVMSETERREVAHKYFNTDVSTRQIAKEHNTSMDCIRHIAAEYKEPGKGRKKIPAVLTESFIEQLRILRYIEGKTLSECQETLKCSKSSISRGISNIKETGRLAQTGQVDNEEKQ